MVQKFRVPRKDPSIAPLFQDDSKWRLVRREQAPPLPRWVRPHFVGAGAHEKTGRDKRGRLEGGKITIL